MAASGAIAGRPVGHGTQHVRQGAACAAERRTQATALSAGLAHWPAPQARRA